MFRLEILKTGTYTDSTGIEVDFTQAVLEEMVVSYNTEVWKAPLVLGHPEHDMPAYGWVDKLVMEGDVLIAEGEEVDSVLVELVNRKAYQNVSVSVYFPDSPGNPNPGKWQLRHVGLLGAVPPAVKGLKPVKFKEVQFACFDGVPAKAQANAPAKAQANTPAKAQANTPAKAQANTPAKAQANTPAKAQADAPAKAQADAEAREQALAAREQALAAREKLAVANEAKAFCEELRRAGRLLPRTVKKAEALLCALANQHQQSLTFQDQELSPVALLRELLAELPVSVNFKEVAPEAQTLNVQAEQIAELARDYVDKRALLGQHVSYSEAVMYVKGGRE